MAQETQSKDKVVTVEQVESIADAQKKYIDAMDKKLSDQIADLPTDEDLPEIAGEEDVKAIVGKFNVPEE